MHCAIRVFFVGGCGVRARVACIRIAEMSVHSRPARVGASVRETNHGLIITDMDTTQAMIAVGRRPIRDWPCRSMEFVRSALADKPSLLIRNESCFCAHNMKSSCSRRWQAAPQVCCIPAPPFHPSVPGSHSKPNASSRPVCLSENDKPAHYP
jgi:hypothetical protein